MWELRIVLDLERPSPSLHSVTTVRSSLYEHPLSIASLCLAVRQRTLYRLPIPRQHYLLILQLRTSYVSLPNRQFRSLVNPNGHRHGTDLLCLEVYISRLLPKIRAPRLPAHCLQEVHDSIPTCSLLSFPCFAMDERLAKYFNKAVQQAVCPQLMFPSDSVFTSVR
jgi:hypothetical protein